MVKKRVRNTAVGLVVTGGIIVGLAILSRRFNLGGQVVDAAGGLGSTVGQAITLPFKNLVDSFSEGAGAVAESGATAGADFQEFVTGNRNAIGDFFAKFDPNRSANAFNVDRARQIVEDAGRSLGVASDRGFVGGSRFGGFGSADAQQQAFDEALAESRRNNPEFFI